jgi:hypothetical protein
LGSGGAALAEKTLDEAGLRYTSKHVEIRDGAQKCVITVPAAIPSSISFRADYQTGLVRVSLINVDRFDRVILEFHSAAIDERSWRTSSVSCWVAAPPFCAGAPLAGIHGQPPA